MNVVISSGHGLQVAGASGYLSEVDEARRVVESVADILLRHGVGVITFHDDLSTSQQENLETIVDFHNSQTRDLDVSIHFNAYTKTDKPMGTECLYVTAAEQAAKVANAIAKAGFINRGAQYRDGLYFLNKTEEAAILIEVCFVDSEADADLYSLRYPAVCRLIAAAISGKSLQSKHHRNIPDNQRDIIASVFGGVDDYNVSAYDDTKVLNDTDFYVALPDRFEGDRPKVEVRNTVNGKITMATIEDVGPWNIDDPYWLLGTRPQAESGTDETGRKTNGAGIDLSPALAKAIGVDGMGSVDWCFVSEVSS